jgi:hypothetical protein
MHFTSAIQRRTAPERSCNGRINVIIARRGPSLAEATARHILAR